MSGIRIVGDWGTSRLRLIRLDGERVTDRFDGPGIAALAGPPEEVLRSVLARWSATGPSAAIALCGMVGSRNGWVEVPYVTCPADRAAWLAGAAQVDLDGARVAIMAGLAGTAPSGAPDVMRGEETQLFGALALLPSLGVGRHLVALPGTHGKWATVEDGRVIGFHTFLTGEMFALLRDHSMLARAGADGAGAPEDDALGFAHGLDRAQGGQLLGGLFEARAAQLVDARSPAWALGYLSGLLIGCEVAEATRPVATGGRIVVIGEPALAARYRQALAMRGLAVDLMDGELCARAGLLLAEFAS